MEGVEYKGEKLIDFGVLNVLIFVGELLHNSSTMVVRQPLTVYF